MPFLYNAPDSHLPEYTKVILDPVVVYTGPDQQFGKLSAADQQQLASYMQGEFTKALASRYTPVVTPGPSTLRIHVTLTGASTTTPVLGTVKQILPVGALVGTVQSAADKPSKLLGSVTYAVEVYDSTTNHLLRAFVVKEFPASENIPASIGTLAAAETGIRKGAKLLVGELQ